LERAFGLHPGKHPFVRGSNGDTDPDGYLDPDQDRHLHADENAHIFRDIFAHSYRHDDVLPDALLHGDRDREQDCHSDPDLDG
jgi:hypothetical protein